MERRQFIKFTSAGIMALATPAFAKGSPLSTKSASMADAFAAPPDSAKPQTFWFWMNGNVTRAGITADLEAIKESGVGGVLNFDAGTGMVKGPVDYGSSEYWNLKKHAIEECQRLDLYFGMHNCPGWSSSGGPWITPELSMQEMSWSEVAVGGGRSISMALPQPPSRLGYYRDAAVVAFPAPPGELPLSKLLTTGAANGKRIDPVSFDAANRQAIVVPPENDVGRLYLEFKEPYAARSISLLATRLEPDDDASGRIVLEASQDGKTFRKIAVLANDATSGDSDRYFVAQDVPAVESRMFRLSSSEALQYDSILFSSAPRIESWRTKANFAGGGNEAPPTPAFSAEFAVDPDSIVDLTRQTDGEGRLRWAAPAGDWVILRIGYTTTGKRNHAAPDGGEGLECDKFSRPAMKHHFFSMMNELLPIMQPIAQRGKVFLEIDSWEVGVQNWTHDFPAVFQERAGYDLIPFLPAMTGRIIGDSDTSDRFLWDLRRVHADLVADNYYGYFDELCAEQGFASYNEPYEPGPFEELQVASRVDVSMGEFWIGLSTWYPWNYEHRRSVKLCASAAHAYGRKIVAAEAFTAESHSGKWQQYPFAMKALGDQFFTQGLTRVVFHRYAMQPHPDSGIAPGMTMAQWGIHFERTNTWWKQGQSWLKYLSRCQFLLQQGEFVADLAYFSGEDAPHHTQVFRESLAPPPPTGYDYDIVNREALLDRAQVVNGRLVFPDGTSYRVLVLQKQEALTVNLMKTIHRLVKAGLVLVGPRPVRAPGLGPNTGEDRTVKKLADELWGDADAKEKGATASIKGRVFASESLQAVLDGLGIQPDFEFTSRSGDAPIRYIHRKIGDTDLYFVCNARRSYEDTVCTFRVRGKRPEFWNPVTGAIAPSILYENLEDGRTRAHVQLDPYGSLFVVFRSEPGGASITRVLKDGKAVSTTKPFPIARQVAHHDISDSFTISLWVKPEIDIMMRRFYVGSYREWTDYYAIYPSDAHSLYGPGHESCGLAVGRNGVALWHRGQGWPYMRMKASAKLEGWSHVAVVYRNGVPSVHVNGVQIEAEWVNPERKSGRVHPGVGKAFMDDGASYYNGDLSEVRLFEEPLSDNRIAQIASDSARVSKIEPFPFSIQPTGPQPGNLLAWENGDYRIQTVDNGWRSMSIRSLPDPQEITGPWNVSFPPNLGAPPRITLPDLISLHTHEDAGVRFFSGTATYQTRFDLPSTFITRDRQLYLDLGRVEICAEVSLNGKRLGALWSRPYRVDVSSAVRSGSNELSVSVVNQWPNRLIGDEQYPPEYEYRKSESSQGFDLGSGIAKVPEWYLNGAPKPPGERVTFSTWKHYNADDPLLESGLIGPVTIVSAQIIDAPR